MGVHRSVAQCDGGKRKTMKDKAKEITVNINGNEERKREQELQWIYWGQTEVVGQVLLLWVFFFFFFFFFFFLLKKKGEKKKKGGGGVTLWGGVGFFLGALWEIFNQIHEM